MSQFEVTTSVLEALNHGFEKVSIEVNAREGAHAAAIAGFSPVLQGLAYQYMFYAMEKREVAKSIYNELVKDKLVVVEPGIYLEDYLVSKRFLKVRQDLELLFAQYLSTSTVNVKYGRCAESDIVVSDFDLYHNFVDDASIAAWEKLTNIAVSTTARLALKQKRKNLKAVLRDTVVQGCIGEWDIPKNPNAVASEKKKKPEVKVVTAPNPDGAMTKLQVTFTNAVTPNTQQSQSCLSAPPSAEDIMEDSGAIEEAVTGEELYANAPHCPDCKMCIVDNTCSCPSGHPPKCACCDEFLSFENPHSTNLYLYCCGHLMHSQHAVEDNNYKPNCPVCETPNGNEVEIPECPTCWDAIGTDESNILTFFCMHMVHRECGGKPYPVDRGCPFNCPEYPAQATVIKPSRKNNAINKKLHYDDGFDEPMKSEGNHTTSSDTCNSTIEHLFMHCSTFMDKFKDKTVWDPACSDGAIVESLRAKGFSDVIGTDLHSGVNFLGNVAFAPSNKRRGQKSTESSDTSESRQAPSKCKSASLLIAKPPLPKMEAFFNRFMQKSGKIHYTMSKNGKSVAGSEFVKHVSFVMMIPTSFMNSTTFINAVQARHFQYLRTEQNKFKVEGFSNEYGWLIYDADAANPGPLGMVRFLDYAAADVDSDSNDAEM
jgi:hypothetical protein